MKHGSIYRKGFIDILRVIVGPIIFSIIIIGIILYGLQQTAVSSSAEGLRVLEDSIRRAVVTAYAVEGRFPGSISHVEENYGIFIDRTRYIVHYRPTAVNMMPEIAVFEINSNTPN